MSPAYLRVREQVAAVLYVRNRLAGEVAQLRRAARAHAALARAEADLAIAERDADAARGHLLAAYAAAREEQRARLRERADAIVIALDAEREAEGALRR